MHLVSLFHTSSPFISLSDITNQLCIFFMYPPITLHCITLIILQHTLYLRNGTFLHPLPPFLFPFPSSPLPLTNRKPHFIYVLIPQQGLLVAYAAPFVFRTIYGDQVPFVFTNTLMDWVAIYCHSYFFYTYCYLFITIFCHDV